ncbi:hypothetical protein DUNSADRAFT_542 [Dunaliella salina]|uniref:Uncharacterized protein n=1 Tax=Dunaliella salina TaxID=3046 RepID=A0ABQ7FYT5_DUNSA|nr:hypothetical protein DUNSADRAFT_542 [Dunaliella salina]|eukprot:KAF5827511.1 hypothetical protein DUNSADRAFT_542 [Dunaliella salina]
MGAICSCCEVVQEYNPDGSPKPIQAKDQMKNDAPDLRRAACACDLEEMEKLLQRMLRKQICSGAQKKEVEDAEIGMTALHYSASANHLRGCVKLILYGADIDACDAKGQTPLHKQMELGYRKVAGFLLKRGASLNAQGKLIAHGNASHVSPPF